MLKKLLFVLGITLTFLVITLAPSPMPNPAPVARTFRVEASSFEFSPSILSVNQGDTVTINLTSTDVVHGVYLDGYDLQVAFDPGQISTLTFIADNPGTFRFRCSVTCGDLHPFMIGKLRVGYNMTFLRGLGLALLAVITVILIPRISNDSNENSV